MKVAVAASFRCWKAVMICGLWGLASGCMWGVWRGLGCSLAINFLRIGWKGDRLLSVNFGNGIYITNLEIC